MTRTVFAEVIADVLVEPEITVSSLNLHVAFALTTFG